MKISTSFLSCKNILSSVEKLNQTDTDYIHIDFIDGEFVIGKEVPFRIIKKIPKVTSKRLDIHLMTNKLKKYIKKMAKLNCEYITFHIEVEDNIEKYINMIHKYGIKCGIAINPSTDIEKLKPYLDKVELVLVMSVEPGYGGQEFNTEVVDKIKNIKKYLVDNKLKTLISVDGGINNINISELRTIPVDIIVSGSYITNSDNYQEKITSLR